MAASSSRISGLVRFGGRDELASIWTVHSVLVLVQFGYGGAYVLNKVALTTGVHPVVFAVYRDVVALSALVPFAYFAERGRRTPLNYTTLGLLVLLGAIGIFGSQMLLLFGLSLATAALSSVVSITIPVCVFIISVVFGLEEIKWRRRDGQAKVLGLISAVTGAVLIPLYRGPVVLGTTSPGVHVGPLLQLQPEANGILASTLSYLNIENWQIGVILLFLAGMSLAIYITLQVPTLKRYPAPVSLTAFAYFFGALVLSATGLLTIQDRSKWVIHQPAALISAVYSGLIPSAANFALQTWALTRTGPVLLASYTPLQAFITSCLAHLFLGDNIHLGSLLGALIIINGLFLITLGQVEGWRAAAAPVEVVQVPDCPPIIKHVPNLEEPLLNDFS